MRRVFVVVAVLAVSVVMTLFAGLPAHAAAVPSVTDTYAMTETAQLVGTIRNNFTGTMMGSVPSDILILVAICGLTWGVKLFKKFARGGSGHHG